MSYAYADVTDLFWADPNNTVIKCKVRFAHLNGAVVLFSAREDDVEAHGREIFARAVAGDFGPIGKYVEP